MKEGSRDLLITKKITASQHLFQGEHIAGLATKLLLSSCVGQVDTSIGPILLIGVQFNRQDSVPRSVPGIIVLTSRK